MLSPSHVPPMATRITRRRFLELAGCGLAAGGLSLRAGESPDAAPPADPEALFYAPLPEARVQCRLCPRQCVIDDHRHGFCGVRENQGGRLVTRVYGRPCAIHVDPIEKKPLFHVFPGEQAFSLATVGCNIHCTFCQNWDISQARPQTVATAYRSPASIARAARDSGARVLAYTYSEPTIFYEYMADCARAGQEAGLHSVMISNGFIQAEPQIALLPLLKAVKIDLKAFTEKFYADICEGSLAPVLESLQRIRRQGTWLEVVVLLIPTLNDGSDEIKRLSDWVVRELGPDVPLHFTRFHPTYRLRHLPPTPPETLLRARLLAMEAGCHFVYTGNVPGLEGQDTLCPACRKTVIRRYGYRIRENRIVKGQCEFCRAPIPGVWA